MIKSPGCRDITTTTATTIIIIIIIIIIITIIINGIKINCERGVKMLRDERE